MKTYELNGVKYRETGEVRKPKAGEAYVRSDGTMNITSENWTALTVPILTPVAPTGEPMRQFRIVPVPTPDTKPARKSQQLGDIAPGTVVVYLDRKWWVAKACDYSIWALVSVDNPSEFAHVSNACLLVTPIGKMEQGVYVPDPEPVVELPLVKTMPAGTVVELNGVPYAIEINSAYADAGMLVNLTTWDRNQAGTTPDLRARVLGTLQPMTLADFTTPSPEVRK